MSKEGGAMRSRSTKHAGLLLGARVTRRGIFCVFKVKVTTEVYDDTFRRECDTITRFDDSVK